MVARQDLRDDQSREPRGGHQAKSAGHARMDFPVAEQQDERDADQERADRQGDHDQPDVHSDLRSKSNPARMPTSAAITNPVLKGALLASTAVVPARTAAASVLRSLIAGTARARKVRGIVNSSDQLAGSVAPTKMPIPTLICQ